jgi:hypothetical protein
MYKALALGTVLLALVGQGGAGSHLAVPLKIVAVPPGSFHRGAPVTLKATIGATTVPSAGPVCGGGGFAIRIYDATATKVTPDDPPRISPDNTHTPAKPVTPYLQQAGAPENPKASSTEVSFDKTWENVIISARKPARLPRLFVALFHVCEVSKVVAIDESGLNLIHNDSLGGSYMGGKFFTANCAGTPRICTYNPE